jgi:periplasmic divalent cation tolerance protein
MTMTTVYAVFGSPEEADRIGRIAIEERLAACVNILAPCRSIYRWQGKIEDAAEIPALFKTRAALADRLIARIVALHDYAVPAVVAWPTTAVFGPYRDWIVAETAA